MESTASKAEHCVKLDGYLVGSARDKWLKNKAIVFTLSAVFSFGIGSDFNPRIITTTLVFIDVQVIETERSNSDRYCLVLGSNSKISQPYSNDMVRSRGFDQPLTGASVGQMGVIRRTDCAVAGSQSESPLAGLIKALVRYHIEVWLNSTFVGKDGH